MDVMTIVLSVPLLGISAAILIWLYFDIRRQSQWKAQKKQEIEDKRERLFQREQAEKNTAHEKKLKDML